MSRSLDDLKPEFRVIVDQFLADCAAAGIDLLVTCTLRPLDEQAALYAQGRTAPGHIVTNAKPGQSAHNFGYAIDVVPVANGKLVWDENNPLWQEIGDFGISRGLKWYGVPDAVFHEDPHFELPNWRDKV